MHFLVIGLGSIGRRHATNLATLYPDARFTVVRHRGGNDEFCRGLQARVVTDLAEVLDDTVDLAVLATPSANHIDTLPTLIERGWPLLVEKPVVTDVADCDEISSLLERATPAVRVAGFNLRHLPSIMRIKDQLEAGNLGQVVRASLIAGQWLPDWRPGADYRSSYSADAERGGGVELDLSHEFDLARWFFGELQVDFATCGQFSDLDIRSHDTAVAALSPLQAPHPLVTVALDYVSRQRVRWYEVVGDRGRIEWCIDGTLDMMTAEGRRSLTGDAVEFDVGSSYVSMLQGVLGAIETGDLTGTQSLSDGLSSTRLALEVRDTGGRL